MLTEHLLSNGNEECVREGLGCSSLTGALSARLSMLDIDGRHRRTVRGSLRSLRTGLRQFGLEFEPLTSHVCSADTRAFLFVIQVACERYRMNKLWC